MGLGFGLRERSRTLRLAAKPGSRIGRCPICERRVLFIREGTYTRNGLRCLRCYSVPRWRAIVRVLHDHFPDWRDRAIHESSPGGPASEKLARECRRYTPTQFFPDVPLGTSHDGVRCEDLERQTFPDSAFDLVVTSDVFEHIFDAAGAFAEIARTLRPGGAHVFTIPWFYWNDTLVRAKIEDGQVRHLEPPDYHGNPIDPNGSLVVREWGRDFVDFIYRASGLTTTVIQILDPSQGIEGQFREVFISRKPGVPPPV